MNKDYGLFFDFIETFSPIGFNGFDSNHPLIRLTSDLIYSLKEQGLL